MKTTIDVDKTLAARVATILGTSSLRETVDVALREVERAEGRRRLAARVREGMLPVPTLAELTRMRSPQVDPGALEPRRAPKRRRTVA
jgi:Arc/MetJ family transcription regulator